jgi:hypothetical protein
MRRRRTHSLRRRYGRSWQARELSEMEDILRRRGFNPHDARMLQVEGMGPEELRGRASHAPGSVGSLEYTHRLRRSTP